MNVGQEISDRSCRLGSRGICQTLIKKAGGDLAIVVTMAPVFRLFKVWWHGGIAVRQHARCAAAMDNHRIALQAAPLCY